MNGTVREIVEKRRLGHAADPDDIAVIALGYSAFARMGRVELAGFGENCRVFCEVEFNREKRIAKITGLVVRKSSAPVQW